MKKICILGVNGFIGHHLSKRIIADTDWEVYGMDMASDRIGIVIWLAFAGVCDSIRLCRTTRFLPISPPLTR